MVSERVQALAEYKKIAEKHNLPSAEQIEKELSVWVEKPPALPFYLRCLSERVSNVLSHLELVLTPSRMCDIIESKFHSEEEKKEIFLVYKELMSVLHKIILAYFINNEEQAKVLKKTWDYYLVKVKPFMKSFLKTQIKGWEKKVDEENINQYYVR